MVTGAMSGKSERPGGFPTCITSCKSGNARSSSDGAEVCRSTCITSRMPPGTAVTEQSSADQDPEQEPAGVYSVLFCPFELPEMELEFQKSQSSFRRSIVACAALLTGLVDLSAGLNLCTSNDWLGKPSDTEAAGVPGIVWLTFGILHLCLGLGFLFVWQRVQIYALNVLSVCVTFRFAFFAVAIGLDTDIKDIPIEAQIQPIVGIVVQNMSAPIVMALGFVNLWLLLPCMSLLWCTTIFSLRSYTGSEQIFIYAYISAANLMILFTVISMSYRGKLSWAISRREVIILRQRNLERTAALLERAQTDSYVSVVHGIVHDMKTLLAAIKTGCGVLKMVVQKPEAACAMNINQEEVVGHMSSAMQVGLGVLDDMGVASELLRGAPLRPVISPVVVEELLKTALECLQLARPASAALSYHVQTDSQIGSVLTDTSLVSRNLLNLLFNASRHTVAGHLTVNAQLVKDQVDETSPWLEISVTDTGVGGCASMPEIWDPFVSTANSTGLGLWVVQKQTEALGGNVGVRENEHSETGSGSIFWFRIPFTQASIPQLRPDRNALLQLTMQTPSQTQFKLNVHELDTVNELVAAVVHGDHEIHGADALKLELQLEVEGVLVTNHTETLKDAGVCTESLCIVRYENQSLSNDLNLQWILMVDDNEAFLLLTASALRADGFLVETALGAVEGMRCMKRMIYSLVVCDYEMPGQTGAEMIASLRAWEVTILRESQIVYGLTGDSRENIKQLCLGAGMQGVWKKPLENHLVAGVLAKMGPTRRVIVHITIDAQQSRQQPA